LTPYIDPVPRRAAFLNRRINIRRAFTLEAVYVALITTLAVLGMTSQSHRPILLMATLLALPCGLGAIVGLYVLTGLFNWIAAGFTTTFVTNSVGGCTASGHCWSRTSGTPVGARGFLFSACVVALFAIAALANVLIVRSFLRGRSSGVQKAASGDDGSERDVP
jgi:hypothetical protein